MFTSESGAAAAPLRVDRLGIDDGLSQQAVNAIAQDRMGFIWFATEDGVDRYDGYTFQHFRHDRADSGSLTNNFVADIQPDSAGRFWLATDGGGILRHDPLEREFHPGLERVAAADGSGLERVRVIRFDHSGRLWIGSREGGLAVFEPVSGRLLRFRHEPDNPASLADDSIFSLLEDRRGNLWVGTLEGLDQLEPATARIHHWPLDPTRPPLVRALLEERPGMLWVGTDAGLMRLNSTTAEQVAFHHDASDPHSLPSDEVNVVYLDSQRRLWVGTSDGLALWDPASAQFHNYRNDPADASSLPDNHILSVREDRTGLLWVGTKFGGVARWNPRTWSFGQHVAGGDEAMASRNIMAFTEDHSGRLWIGTFGGGITVRDPNTGTSITLRHDPRQSHGLSDDRVMALLTDHEGIVWAGTMAGGLDRIVPQTGSITVYGHDPRDSHTLSAAGIMSLLEDSTGRIWVGTYGGGLCSFDREKRQFHRYVPDPRELRVTALAEDRTGRLWVGTDGGGLELLDPVSGQFFRIRHDPRDPQSLSGATVYSLHVDAHGTVWVGTRGGGLDRLIGSAVSPEKIRFENFGESRGLPNNTIYGIHSDAAGRLWVSTNHGLARFDPRAGTARAFHRNHGLQEEEFNFGAHYASRTGRLYFGGASGYNAFLPASLLFNDSPPPVVLTSVSELGRSLPVAPGVQSLHLRYRDVVTFEFAALDFATPRANRFEFKLEGFDPDWEHAGTRRSVTYTNLPGGQYQLRARASTPDGVWSERPFALRLEVDPAPWASWWARVGYALLLAAVSATSWFAHRRSLVREARYSRRLEEEVRTRTCELATRNTDLEIVNRRLEQASVTDQLTGLGNRRSLIREMPRLIATSGVTSSPRDGARLTLMLVDLDHLKPINDQYGHEAGDQVLEQVAKLLVATLRDSDRVVRWGGDEFVIVRTRSNLEDGAALAEEIRRSIARCRFRISASRHARTSCSIGFACYPFIAEAPLLSRWEEVLNVADMALYRAKTRRNAWLGWSGLAAAAELPELFGLLAEDPATVENGGYIEVRVSPTPDSDMSGRSQVIYG